MTELRPLEPVPVGQRPVAQAAVVEVDGGLFQAQCPCRWRGRRHHEFAKAAADALRHNALCGVCQRWGRQWMHACSCQPCDRLRGFRSRLRPLAPPLDGATPPRADGNPDAPATPPHP